MNFGRRDFGAQQFNPGLKQNYPGLDKILRSTEKNRNDHTFNNIHEETKTVIEEEPSHVQDELFDTTDYESSSVFLDQKVIYHVLNEKKEF